MNPLSIIESVKELIRPLLEEQNFELVDILYRREQGKMVLRLLADKEGGITLNDCALLNEKIGALLDEKDIMNQSYILEVSSPGVDRPLVTKRDFERVKGRLVRVVLKESLLGKFEHVGKLEDILDQSIRIKTEKFGVLEIKFENIKRARQEVVV